MALCYVIPTNCVTRTDPFSHRLSAEVTAQSGMIRLHRNSIENVPDKLGAQVIRKNN